VRNRLKIRLLVLLLVGAMSCTGIARAQEEGADRDPFEKTPHVSETKPAANEWGRDPFSNPLSNKPASQPLAQKSGKRVLTGIIMNEQVRLAIINGEILKEGGMVGDRKLEEIRKQSVVLRNVAGGSEELFLEDFSFNKP